MNRAPIVGCGICPPIRLALGAAVSLRANMKVFCNAGFTE